jgi:hypothetical protein
VLRKLVELKNYSRIQLVILNETMQPVHLMSGCVGSASQDAPHLCLMTVIVTMNAKLISATWTMASVGIAS